MDALVAAALEEVCARLSPGIPVAGLWPAVRDAAEAAGLPLGSPVKRALWTRLLVVPVVSLVEVGGDGAAPLAAGDPAERDVEEAERWGVRLVASLAIRDNFLGMYERRFAKTDLSGVQKAALECVAASRYDQPWLCFQQSVSLVGLVANCELVVLRNCKILSVKHLSVSQSPW
ncbi:hypothetical protein QOZ80_5BG0435350 [Eleusine coracana subsp. coracana]|nr:hypothetical protein QOZ80_5BG0435350 [Eleusine coracana subsp. coracana]